MKFLDIIKTSSSNLWRNKGRTFLTVVAVFIGAFTISFTSSVGTGVNDYINRQLSVFGNSKAVTISKQQKGFSISRTSSIKEYDENSIENSNGLKLLTQKDLDELKSMKELDYESILPTLEPRIDYIQIDNSRKLTAGILVFGKDFSPDIKTGREIKDKNEVMLTKDYADEFNISPENLVGKTLKIRMSDKITTENQIQEVKVVGILNKNLIQTGAVLMNDELAKDIFNFNSKSMPENAKNQFFGAYGYFKDETLFSDDEKFEKVKKKFNDKGYSIARLQDRIKSINDLINGISGALIVFGGIALLAASFGISNTLYMSVRERTREIGLMKSMGLSSGKIFTLFSMEAILIGLIGSVLGILTASSVGATLNKLASESFLKGLEGFNLTIFTAENSIMIILIIISIAFFAGTLPSRKASKKDPIEALRYE